MTSFLLDGTSLDDTLGATYIANIVATFLFGITTVQSCYYYSRYSDDSRLLRFVIATLWILDLIHLVCLCAGVYFYTVTNYANPAVLTSFTWSFNARFIVGILNDVIIRLIFIHRIWKISNRNKYVTGFMGTCTVAILVCGTMFFVKGFQVTTYEALNAETHWIFYVTLSSMVGADVITVVSIYSFIYRRRSSIRGTRSIAHKIMLYTVNTSGLTCLATIVCLVTYATMPTNLIFLAIYFVLPKLYLNAILGLLNSRKKLRKQLANSRMISIAISTPMTVGSSSMIQGVHEEPKRHDMEGTGNSCDDCTV